MHMNLKIKSVKTQKMEWQMSNGTGSQFGNSTISLEYTRTKQQGFTLLYSQHTLSRPHLKKSCERFYFDRN